MENLAKLIKELCRLPSETEWLEFKCNNYEAEILGQNISALERITNWFGVVHFFHIQRV